MSGCHPTENEKVMNGTYREQETVVSPIIKRIQELQERIRDVENSIRIKYPHKCPHKCPVCDGFGVIDTSSICPACEGKCIVWG